MRNARAYFEDEMSKVSVLQMLSWADTLENASLTTFIVKDKLQAAQIFAYQNDRGKKLPIWKSSRHISCYSFSDRGTTVTEQPI